MAHEKNLDRDIPTRGVGEIWRGLKEWKDFKVGDSIIWKDPATKTQFNTPAFNYGEGPFKLLSIFSPKEGVEPVMFEILAYQGKQLVSWMHFKKHTGA
jgi:hypothetical protein